MFHIRKGIEKDLCWLGEIRVVKAESVKLDRVLER